MALKGNLRDFTVTQLLNLVHIAKKTGALTVDGPSEAIAIFFREGKLAYAQIGQEDNSLAAILHRANKLTAAQYRVINERAVNMSDKELGLLLINANYISQQDILASLQAYTLSAIQRLFTWMDGFFRFEVDRPPPDGKIPLHINLENIILDGTRRLREWEHLQDEIPSLEMALKFTERPGANMKNVNLNVEEWKVVSYINPKNSIRQIALALKMNDLEIRRVIYALLSAGLVEIVRPDGPIPISPQAQLPMPVADKEEQKSLIRRVINRIRSL